MESFIDATKLPGYRPEWEYGYTPEETVTAIVLDDDDTFDQWEAPRVLREFVCAVCHAELVEYFVPNDRRVLIACSEHGNIVNCGRVTRNTVTIEIQKSRQRYREFIRNLPDLWGELIPQPRTAGQNLRDLGF